MYLTDATTVEARTRMFNGLDSLLCCSSPDANPNIDDILTCTTYETETDSISLSVPDVDVTGEKVVGDTTTSSSQTLLRVTNNSVVVLMIVMHGVMFIQ